MTPVTSWNTQEKVDNKFLKKETPQWTKTQKKTQV